MVILGLYGSERMSADIPEIEPVFQTTNEHDLKGWRAECPFLDCKWVTGAVELYDEIDTFISEHRQWHEDGMPA